MLNPALERLRQTERNDPDRLDDLDLAVLAFARWQGLTNEGELQRSVAHRVLDDLILRMEPENWSGLKDFVNVLGESQTRQFLKYSLERSLADLSEKRAEVERLFEEPETARVENLGAAEHTDEGSSPRPRRRRDRER